MGIWHHRRALSGKAAPSIFSPFTSNNTASKITLDADDTIGLLRFPSTSKTLYVSAKPSGMVLAVDGKITHVSDTPVREINDLTEYMADLYISEGIRFLEKLEGEYSAVLYDGSHKNTYLYRPAASGIPLYYVAKNGWLSVSSNPALLLRRADINGTLDEAQLSTLFFVQNGRWRTPLFSEISELTGGSLVTVNDSGLTETHSESDFLEQRPLCDGDFTVQYRRLLERAVQQHLEPGRRYGIMLSSGMDSGSIAFFASKLLKKQHGSLQAFSWSLPNFAADETRQIKKLCDVLGIRLHVFDGEAHRPFGNLDHLSLKPDYPFSNLFDPMAEATYRLAQQHGVNALFNGHFGDNLFKDDRYVLAEMARDGKWWLLLRTTAMVLWRLGGVNRFLKAPAVRTLVKYMLSYKRSGTVLGAPPPWLSPYGAETWQSSASAIAGGQDATADLLKRILDKTERDYGIQRRLTAPYGIERIEPYRDTQLLSFALALPSYCSFARGQSKFFAREAMRDRLPEFIRMQPRRGILEPYVRDSYTRYRRQVRERLFDEPDTWSLYVDLAWLESTLQKRPETIAGKEMLVIWYALQLAPWLRSVRPGGKFYEGEA